MHRLRHVGRRGSPYQCMPHHWGRFAAYSGMCAPEDRSICADGVQLWGRWPRTHALSECRAPQGTRAATSLAQLRSEWTSSKAPSLNSTATGALRERFRDHLLQWHAAACTPSENQLDLDVADLERSFGAAFAALFVSIVSKAPWMQWAESFVPFLPSTCAGRTHFNVRLLRFFDVHGRAMWEQYFCTGRGARPCVGPSQRFLRARAAMGLLIFDLYDLEGVDALVFLDAYPHPYWPSLLLRPVHLKRVGNARLYLEEQHSKRWPDQHRYLGIDKSHHRAKETWPAPCASFIEWAAGRSKGSCAADGWLEAGATPEWFASVLDEMKATTSLRCDDANEAACPYTCVIMADHIPERWKVRATPPSKWVWDTASKSVVEWHAPT